MSETNTSDSGGIGFTGSFLTIVFIVLKLLHVINWSWVWVLAPLWIPLAIVLAVFIIVFLTTAVVCYIDRI